MYVLKTWAGAFALTLALSSGLAAEVSVSQSNDPTATIDARLARLLGQERAGLALVEGARLAGLVAEPTTRRPLFATTSATATADAPTRAAAARKVAAKGGPAPRVTDPLWLAAQPAPVGDQQFRCLTTALYFEARGEGLDGQAAVAEVILNRVEAASYPNNICGVVNQKGNGGCQFSFTCDGKPETVADKRAWDRAARIARAMLDGAPRELTQGATHFHTPAVNPSWARKFTRTARIGSHIFYRQPMRVAAATRAPETPAEQVATASASAPVLLSARGKQD